MTHDIETNRERLERMVPLKSQRAIENEGRRPLAVLFVYLTFFATLLAVMSAGAIYALKFGGWV